MTDAEKIDRAIASIKGANRQVAFQERPKEVERDPPASQRKIEREGRSDWSGGSAGGGVWGGRSRS